MDSTCREQSAPATAYSINGRKYGAFTPGFAEAIANAHADHRRPRCLCQAHGVEMYVARLGDGHVVKRMPYTGSSHAPDCPSYELPAELSGLGQVLGSAIVEDPSTGATTLKLDFPLCKMPGRSISPNAGSGSDSVKSSGARLSLRGLLHYLWDQAELTRWSPAFAGRRSWATVRKLLLHAAAGKAARGEALASRLYIPEVFSVEQRHAINTRRLAQWAAARAAPGKPQPLMLLIAEVKEIVPARFGHKAVVKHLPDQAFAMDPQLYGRLGRHFADELALWAASDSLHMMMVATFAVLPAGVPTLMELSLMPTTAQWLPVDDGYEQQLVARLVHEGRQFTKALRYNMPTAAAHVGCVLTDTGAECCPLRIEYSETSEPPPDLEFAGPNRPDPGCDWRWHPLTGSMPPLPRRIAKHQAPTMA